MIMKQRTRRTFTEDFKREAVALITEQGYKYAEAARSLDIRENMLRRWVQEFDAEATGERLNSHEREELQRLREENRRLRLEKEILKKASQYFAKEMK